ncbi:cysteine dioxygenase family protein [Achromobacter aloeverae]|uniref:Cysteine dioxygenase n=1 Tax=Achromobacter aloeverae TaxID=1750518 RepID=A0A4V1MRM7_9BURK|nr:cysteine dioxygenase family protein [Achromobacter aloeverae]RXN85181.1 cysteine dioxygenase [Achromobacter aloeverae]
MLISTVAPASQAGRSILGDVGAAIARAIDATPAEHLPRAVCDILRDHLPATGLLSAQQRQGQENRYTRHVLYAHPQGLFTIVALVWRPGQLTPIHGHYTWCAYFILEGEMQEEHFAWDPAAQCARPCGSVERPQGDAAASHAGMDQIHRLRNDSADTAISIHVYGVDGPRVSTHVNRIAELAPA